MIVLEKRKGERSTLIVPEGGEGQGWRSFRDSVGLFLFQNSPIRKWGGKVGVLSSVCRENTSFAQAVLGRKMEAGSLDSLDEDIPFLFDTSKCLLVVRERAADPWVKIERAVKKFVSGNVHLNIFCCNLAVFLCEDNVKLSKMR